jgi:hypothetical protein
MSIKQPFQSGYLIDIPRGFERLEIAVGSTGRRNTLSLS